MNRAMLLTIASIATVTTVVGANLTYASSNSNQGVPSQIQTLQSMVSSLQDTVSNQANEISQLQQTISGQGTAISDLQNTTTNQAHQIDTLNTTVNQQQNSISSLQSSLSSQAQEISALQADDSSQASKIEQLNSALTHIEQQIATMEQPSAPTGAYTITGTLKDSNGTPFFSPLYLMDSTGNSVEEQSMYDSSTGQFSFANIPDGTYTFKFGMPEYQFSSPKITVNGDNVSGVTLTTKTPVYDVSGVALLNGQPIVGKSITIFDPYGYTGGYFGPSITDSTGHFSVHGLANGTYTIYIGIDLSESPMNPNSAIASGQVTVNGGNVTDMTIEGLEAGSPSNSGGSGGTQQTGGYTVQGTLIDGNGHPFSTPMHLLASDGQSYFQSSWNPSTGSFAFNHIPNGTYTLYLDFREFLMSPVTVNVNEGDITNLAIKYPGPTYTISGSALLNGAPLSDQSITLETPGEFTGGFWGNTDSSGHFTLSGIPVGTYTILIGCDQGQPQNTLSTAKAIAQVTVSNSDVSNLVIGN